MKFREIILLILIIAAGTCVYHYQTGNWRDWQINWDWDEGFFFPGREFNFEETRIIEGPLPGRIEIVNGHGWVELRGEERQDVKVIFKKRIWRKNESQAGEVSSQLRMTEQKTADALILSTNREEFRKRNFETGFIVSVPAGMKVKVVNSYGTVGVELVAELVVENRHGRIFASDIAGAWDMRTSYEDIEARRLNAAGQAYGRHGDIIIAKAGGDVRIEGTYGRISMEEIEGNATVIGQHAEVDLAKISGTAEIESSYEDITVFDAGKTRIQARHAAVRAEKIRGDLSISTSYEPVEVSAVEGDLSVEGHNVAVNALDIGGDSVYLSTSYEPAAIAGFSAKLEAIVRHADLTLKPKSLNGGINVNAEYCDIDFYWPPDESAPIEAKSRGGSIVWEIKAELESRKSNGTEIVRAFSRVENRPAVFLSTTYGDIRIMPGSGSF